MITESYDVTSDPVITPMSFFGEKKSICDMAIATFSREIYMAVLARYNNEQIGEIQAANRIKPGHLIDLDGMKAVFYLSEIGAALASTDVIEVNWKTGAWKFILFGSAGSLDKKATTGRYVIPTAAYRDEGMSYHYAPPSDYIMVRNADYLAKVFDRHHYPFIQGIKNEITIEFVDGYLTVSVARALVRTRMTKKAD